MPQGLRGLVKSLVIVVLCATLSPSRHANQTCSISISVESARRLIAKSSVKKLTSMF